MESFFNQFAKDTLDKLDSPTQFFIFGFIGLYFLIKTISQYISPIMSFMQKRNNKDLENFHAMVDSNILTDEDKKLYFRKINLIHHNRIYNRSYTLEERDKMLICNHALESKLRPNTLKNSQSYFDFSQEQLSIKIHTYHKILHYACIALSILAFLYFALTNFSLYLIHAFGSGYPTDKTIAAFVGGIFVFLSTVFIMGRPIQNYNSAKYLQKLIQNNEKIAKETVADEVVSPEPSLTPA